jgi:hypothetical protein
VVVVSLVITGKDYEFVMGFRQDEAKHLQSKLDLSQ